MTPLEHADSLVAAFARSDSAAYFSHFAADATFLFHDTPGLVGSRAAYEELWAGWERDLGFRVVSCESTGRHVQEYAGVAVFTHDVRTVRVVGGEEEVLHERETIVLRSEGDGWTCVHEHLSPAPQPDA